MNDYVFGNFIRHLREKQGLSQHQLGALVGVSNKAVSKWETGTSIPQPDVLIRLGEVLGVTVDELLAGEPRFVREEARKGEKNMKKQALWEAVEQKLYDRYSSRPPLEIYNWFLQEKEMLENSNTILYMEFCAELIREAEKLGLRVTMNGAICEESLTAYLMGVAVFNPLPPHYRCPKCRKTEFVPGCPDGWDLPEKKCSCGKRMERDGHHFCVINRWGRVKDLPSGIVNCSSPLFRNMALALFRRHFPDRVLITLIPPERQVTDPFLAMWIAPGKPGLPDKLPLIPEEYGISREEFINMRASLAQFSFYPGTLPEEIFRLEQATGTRFDRVDFLSDAVLAEFTAGRIDDILYYGNPYFMAEEIRMQMEAIRPASRAALLRARGLLYHSDGGHLAEQNLALLKMGEIRPEEIISHWEDVYEMVIDHMRKKGLDSGGSFALSLLERIVRPLEKENALNEADIGYLQELELPAWAIECLRQTRYLHPRSDDLRYVRIGMIAVWYKLHFPVEYRQIMLGGNS